MGQGSWTEIPQRHESLSKESEITTVNSCVPSKNRDPGELEKCEVSILEIIEAENTGPGVEENESSAPTFSEAELQEFAAHMKVECAGVWPRLNGAAATMPALKVYQECVSQMTHNLFGPQVPLTSHKSVEAWRNISSSHPDDKWLRRCIQYGFPLQYRGPPLKNIFKGNHPSTVNTQTR